MELPKFTIVYNRNSADLSRWTSTHWEFYDTDKAAMARYDELNAVPGTCATKRPFYKPYDVAHMGAADQFHISVDEGKFAIHENDVASRLDVFDISEEEIEEAFQEFLKNHICPARLFQLARGLREKTEDEANHILNCPACHNAHEAYRHD